jgi:site-specific DNA-cytosine methylase
LGGERSGLWAEYARLIRELRPRFAIVENTPGLLSLGMGKVLGDMAEVGYDSEWHSISAAALGADHERDRVWIVAYPHGTRIQLTVRGNYNRKGLSAKSGDGLATVLKRMMPTLTAHDVRGGAKPERSERMWESSARGLDLSSTLRAVFPESTGIINPSWGEGYMGFPTGWTELEPSVTPSSRKSRKSSGERS